MRRYNSPQSCPFWAQAKIDSCQHRFAIKLHCILAVTGFIAMVCGANVALSTPSWGIACGDGRVDTILDNFDAPWVFCCTACPSIPNPTLRTVPGCNGNAMAVDYDLTNACPASTPPNQSWIVLQRSLPPEKRDLTKYTHLRLAWRGSNLNSHDSIEVKLKDNADHLCATSLKSMTDMPVWRAFYIDLRELTGSCTIDLANIVGLEIAIVQCAGCEAFDNPDVRPREEHVGTLYLDELAAVNLKLGAVYRLTETGFEMVTPNAMVRAEAANALRARITSSGPGKDLIPAWFPEIHPNFDTYVQAEALLVFVYEYEQTGNIAFLLAAQNMAAKLLSLQIPSGKTQSGAWFTARNETLQPPSRPLPRVDPPLPCDGNETMMQDPDSGQFVATNIDACTWVGNVGWVLIALAKLQRSGFYSNPTALKDALDRGAAWVATQSQYRRNTPDPNPLKAYPNLISFGTEGNISAYFGLVATRKGSDAVLLGNAIFQFAWDPLQDRMKPGVGPSDVATATDVSGSWGVMFLRSKGRIQEALDSQAYTASVMRVCSFDGPICGYGDIAGPYTPAVEFTAQAAAAGIKEADFVMQQISPLQMRCNAAGYPGAFPGAADHWYGGPLTPWNTTMCGVSPTAWVYFSHNRDPLLDLFAPPPICNIQLNQTTFVNGDRVIAQVLRIANPGTVEVPVELKIWFEVPGLAPIPFANVGADGSVKLPPGFTTNAGPLTLFPVTAALPRGTYGFNCRLLNPVTGQFLTEDISPFILQ